MAASICKALLVGNSVFEEDPHNLPELKGPINDLALMRDALTDPELGLFAADQVRLLPERNKREIATAMEEFFRGAGRDDMLLLYYSGHGKQDEYDNLYLCARDTRTDLLVSTGISDVEINGIMRASSASTFIVILDCCHSGAFKGGGLPTNLRGSGRFLLTSSRRGQLSVDAAEVTGASLFTRHLAEALTLGTLDDNDDGYVSLNEVYNHVLARLGEESKQIPQRHFDNTVGDPALARSRTGSARVPKGSGAGVPRLEVSESEIVLRDVQPGEVLPPEIIDVYNAGGGTLDWTVESDTGWITVTPDTGFFQLALRPEPGVNRGNVRVRDRGLGGSRTVRVVVHVLDRPDPPRLQLSDPDLDFGVLSQGSQSPRRTVQLVNLGGGGLDARVWATEPWIEVHHFGDAVSATVDTATVGALSGSIMVHSRGGRAEIAVWAVVEPGPLLDVAPRAVDFGR
ncbi:MAG: caspase, EACC1-associated type, partial [Acidimicrobiales bacterium]